MKKLILLLIVLVSTIGISNAQPGRQGPRMSPEEREKQMAETLGLDEAQQKKVSEINAKYSESFSEIRQQMQDANEDAHREMFPKMRELNDTRNKEIRAVLNEEQIKKFDEMQAQRTERMRSRRPPGERGGSTRPGK